MTLVTHCFFGWTSADWVFRCTTEQPHSCCLKNTGCVTQAECVYTPLRLTCVQVSVFVHHQRRLRLNTVSAFKLSPSSSYPHSSQANMLLTREKEMKVFSPTTCSGGSCFLFPQKCILSIREERCSPSAWWPKSTAVKAPCKWLWNSVCVVARLLFFG